MSHSESLGLKHSSASSASSFEERSKHRGQWGNSIEFMLACLGNMVGFGNIWRFPYLVYKNGGGTFVIVYIITLLLVGFPIVFIETALAQYSQSASGEVFANIAPMFKGIGYCSVAAVALISTYYNVLIAWTVFYFIEAFTQKWSDCNHDYNTDSCITIQMALNYTKYGRNISTSGFLENKTSSADEFFNRYVLNKTSSLGEVSWPQWPQPGLTLSLLVSTIFTVACLIKGVESSGKAVYFTALFPYVMLIILFFRGITLKGAVTGIKFYVWPSDLQINYSSLFVDAVVQVFYSVGAGMGNLLTFSSFNKFHDKLLRKIVIITVGDAVTSIFAGFVVFSMVGFVANLLGKSVTETVTEGTGLVFVVILEGMTQMPLSFIWIFCFVSMLFFLGIDSLFGCVETVNTFLHDYLFSIGWKVSKHWVTIGVGFAVFVGGLTMTMRSGIHILTLMDTFSAGMPILAAAIGDCVIVALVYGTDNFLDDFHFMTGTRLDPISKFCFKYLLLLVVPWLIVILFFNDLVSKFIWTIDGKISEKSPPYPFWALLIGWIMGLGPVLLIPIFAAHFLITSKQKTWKEAFKEGTEPTGFYRQAAVFYGSYDDAHRKHKKDREKESKSPTDPEKQTPVDEKKPKSSEEMEPKLFEAKEPKSFEAKEPKTVEVKEPKSDEVKNQ